MQFVVLAVVAILLYLGTMGVFRFWQRRYSEGQVVEGLPRVCGSFVVGAFLIGLVATGTVIPVVTPNLCSFIAIALLFLLYATDRWWKLKYQIIWFPFLALFGTSLCPMFLSDLPFEMSNQLVMAAVWTSVMTIVVYFDKLPLVTFLTLSSWLIACGVMTLTPSTLPSAFAVTLLLIVAPVWGIVNMLARFFGVALLDRYVSMVIGFIMGGIIAICVGYGCYMSAMTFCSYYLFELFFILLCYCGFHPFGMQKGEFVFSTCLAESQSIRLVRILFGHLIILSLLAVLMWRGQNSKAGYIVLAIVLIDLWNRYRTLGTPVPGYKEMWGETKKMCAMAWDKCKKEPISSEQKAIRSKNKKKSTLSQKKSLKKISKKAVPTKKVVKRKKKK